MKSRKKINKLKVGILVFLIVFTISVGVFGRFIYNSIREAYFTAKQFYFSSNILTVNGTGYQYDNWGGIGDYEISFDLYSFNTELSKLDYDLNYKVTCESLSTDKITCGIGTIEGGTTANGTIYVSQDNTSIVTIAVRPIAEIAKGETVKLKVTASTEAPYIKEISCVFSLYIKMDGQNTYSIEDAVNSDYALLKLVNGKDSATLSTLEFDPTELRLDMNDEICQNMTKKDVTTINGKEYITKVEITLPKESAKNIKFYKVDKTQNYTYPSGSVDSAITVNI